MKASGSIAIGWLAALLCAAQLAAADLPRIGDWMGTPYLLVGGKPNAVWRCTRAVHAAASPRHWAAPSSKRRGRGSTGDLQAKDGGVLLMETAPDEFLATGRGLTIKVSRDPDTDHQIAGIAAAEEVTQSGADWNVAARLNGDQSNQGRQLSTSTNDVRIYRLRLYHAAP